MAAGLPDIIDIIEPHAGLGDSERVVWWLDHLQDDPRLKIIDASLGEENIIPPPRDDRIPTYPAMIMLFKEVEVLLAHLVVGIGTLHRGVTDKSVLLTWRLPTGIPISLGPERPPALRTGLTLKTVILEERKVELG